MSDREHRRLLGLVQRLPEDYEPFGVGLLDRARSCGARCRFARELGGAALEQWRVCTNPASHRSGLLTHVEQGCQRYTSQKMLAPRRFLLRTAPFLGDSLQEVDTTDLPDGTWGLVDSEGALYEFDRNASPDADGLPPLIGPGQWFAMEDK